MLDVGCGTGANLALLENYGRPYGIDYSLSAGKLSEDEVGQRSWLGGMRSRVAGDVASPGSGSGASEPTNSMTNVLPRISNGCENVMNSLYWRVSDPSTSSAKS